MVQEWTTTDDAQLWADITAFEEGRAQAIEHALPKSHQLKNRSGSLINKNPMLRNVRGSLGWRKS